MRQFKILNLIAVLVITAILSACASQAVYRSSTLPLKAHSSVELNRYLGKWYEIYRVPNRFEDADCRTVTAEYSLRPDGRIKVLNTCFKNDKKNEAVGVANIVEGSNNAKLKVSFFRPFYGDYWILDLAADYSWVLVGEPSDKYFWILARDKTLNPTLESELLEKAEKLGYNRKDFIKPKNDL
jgi:apolipoprotein D and lipocalin family protein